jgi:tRNA (guanine6-N2)-methyltransferase
LIAPPSPVQMSAHTLYEAEIAPGLEAIAAQEITASSADVNYTDIGIVQFTYNKPLQQLLSLKTVNAVYLLRTFSVPRPKALLGHQHFHAILALINIVQKNGGFQTLNIDAAGSDSSVMQRLKSELAAAANLETTNTRGDLLIRLRPSKTQNGWDVLIRLTPRPLATRDWRVANYEGALNASVAHAMISLTQPQPDDVFVNLCCGSGTLLIERMRSGTQQFAIGCDIAKEPLTYAKLNSTAAGIQPILIQADARQLPLDSGSVNKLCVDLPFGQLVGTHTENTTLYPAVLLEAGRIATKDALFIVITHEIRLIENLLQQQKEWRTTQTLKVTLNGLHPRIYVLQRR